MEKKKDTAVEHTTAARFWKRVWILLSNPFLYLLKGKIRW
jgi:hypothetical protein